MASPCTIALGEKGFSPKAKRSNIDKPRLAILWPSFKGARITVAGQWRNLTALPEHSFAVAWK